MGLGNWLLKNVPGAPGHTATHLAEMFIKISEANKDAETENIFEAVYLNRLKVSVAYRFPNTLFSRIPVEAILENTNGDFAIFVFMIMCLESKKFRNDAASSIEALHIILGAIREGCKLKLPNIITLDNSEYLLRGGEFTRMVNSL